MQIVVDTLTKVVGCFGFARRIEGRIYWIYYRMELRPFPHTNYVRPCQLTSVANASREKNKSGIHVLPCGVGKTFTQIIQLCQDVQEKNTCDFLITAPSREILSHWKAELQSRTTLNLQSMVYIESSDMKIHLASLKGSVRVFLITYSMLRTKGKVSKQLKKIPFTRIVCDECHHVPGRQTMRMLTDMKKSLTDTRWSGLTASPFNSNDKDFNNMVALIGPQIDSGLTWKQMESESYIASLSLNSVYCQFPKNWNRKYELLLNDTKNPDRMLLMRKMELFNPNKLAYIEMLIKTSIENGHKFILFCDCVMLLQEIASILGCDYIDGSTDKDTRTRVYTEIRNGTRQMILVSRIADTGVDLPNVDWAAQIDSLGGSCRQKTQRVGRVLRYEAQKQAAFFDVVTMHDEHTREMKFLDQRTKFLISQDYIVTRKFIQSSSLCHFESKFLQPDVQQKLIEHVENYPNLQRLWIGIMTDYKQKLEALKGQKPYKKETAKITKQKNHAVFTMKLREFHARRRQLLVERDRAIREANLSSVHETEHDDDSEDEDEESEDSCE